MPVPSKPGSNRHRCARPSSRDERQGLSPTARIIITIVVSLVIIAAGTVGVAVILLSRYGRELAEAIARYKANPGLGGSLATGMFEQGCLRVSRATPGFCDGVPGSMDILRGGRWQLEQSRRAGIRDQFSGQIFAQLQAHCEARRR